MRALAAALLLALAACATTPRPTRAPGPREAAGRFLAAVEAGRWPDAWSLLSARWRARLTPERLAADRLQGGALAGDVLARARQALAAAPVRAGDEVSFPVGEGKAVRLVREAGGWRIDALE